MTDGGAGPGGTTSSEEENARLRERVAFLEKKLNLVGSITRHDVLNQLTAIVGYNELLGMMIQDPKQKAFLEKERTAVDKIRRQFQFAKDYQNIATEPPRWQTIRGLVIRAGDNLDLRGVKILNETGTASILGDPALEKVFVQIFDNALRHGGTVSEIRITLRAEGTSGTLVIENNGAGIPEAEKSKIFERGFGKGTGWGLFLAREILLATGITISETGEPGKGVRFEIVLPPGTLQLQNTD